MNFSKTPIHLPLSRQTTKSSCSSGKILITQYKIINNVLIQSNAIERLKKKSRQKKWKVPNRITVRIKKKKCKVAKAYSYCDGTLHFIICYIALFPNTTQSYFLFFHIALRCKSQKKKCLSFEIVEIGLRGCHKSCRGTIDGIFFPSPIRNDILCFSRAAISQIVHRHNVLFGKKYRWCKNNGRACGSANWFN